MDDQRLIQATGDYKKLIVYQKAEAIFDITYYFVHNYLRRGDRTIDQMQQAARSGKQNISEGYSRAGTSVDTAIRLIDVAKASMQELFVDYEDFLRTRGFRQWEDNSVEVEAMRNLCRKHNDSAFYMEIVKTRPPETIANIAICLIKQNDYLMFKLLQSLEKQFLENGGFRERMTRMRLQHRNKQ